MLRFQHVLGTSDRLVCYASNRFLELQTRSWCYACNRSLELPTRSWCYASNMFLCKKMVLWTSKTLIFTPKISKSIRGHNARHFFEISECRLYHGQLVVVRLVVYSGLKVPHVNIISNILVGSNPTLQKTRRCLTQPRSSGAVCCGSTGASSAGASSTGALSAGASSAGASETVTAGPPAASWGAAAARHCSRAVTRRSRDSRLEAKVLRIDVTQTLNPFTPWFHNLKTALYIYIYIYLYLYFHLFINFICITVICMMGNVYVRKNTFWNIHRFQSEFQG